MEYFELLKNLWTSICEWLNFNETLAENMNTLREKLEELESIETDLDGRLANEGNQFGRKRKRQVENWLKKVRHKKTEVQVIEQNVGERRYLSRSRFLRHVEKKILEVTELTEKGEFPEGLFIDIHDPRDGLFLTMPLVGQTTARRNLEKIWECLVNDEIISIGVYGMGGVGKTTIMTHMHNRLLEDPSFAHRVYWVTVSQESSVQKLQNDIAKYIKLDLSNEDDERRRAYKFNALSGIKKFALVLDDMWKEFPLQEIGIPIGVHEGKLIITSRSIEVCRRMNCQQNIEVECLSTDEAWDLFKEKLGSNNVLDQEVEEIAKSVAKECAGLPLAIITVASRARAFKNIYDWQDQLAEAVKGRIHMAVEMSLQNMSTTQTISINSLKTFQKTWTIKVMVLRQGAIEPYQRNDKNGKLWKIILVDDEGTKVQAVIFDDAIQKFEGKIFYNKTYFISNGTVRQGNKEYPSINPEKELVLKHHTDMKEAETNLNTKNITYNFVTFEEATKNNFVNRPSIDMFGFVTKVKQSFVIKKKDGKITHKREIILMNNELNSIVLNLWGDMAINEGQLLEHIADEKPIIAVSKLYRFEYQGGFQVSTTNSSTIQVNPACREVLEMKKMVLNSQEQLLWC